MTWSDHPYYFPDYVDAFTFGAPFLLENLAKILTNFLTAVKAHEPHHDDSDDGDIDMQEVLSGKINDLAKGLSLPSPHEG